MAVTQMRVILALVVIGCFLHMALAKNDSDDKGSHSDSHSGEGSFSYSFDGASKKTGVDGPMPPRSKGSNSNSHSGDGSYSYSYNSRSRQKRACLLGGLIGRCDGEGGRGGSAGSPGEPGSRF